MAKLDKTIRALETINSRRWEQKVDALLRSIYLDRERLDYPDRLLARRFHMYAQNEEDGLVLALIEESGRPVGRFVDIGCGHNGGNSAFLARELLYGGVMIDGDPDLTRLCEAMLGRSDVSVVTAFVTRQNINDLIVGAGVRGEIDFLSIDIDGNDLWIWRAIDVVQPRIVCVEYNSLYGAEAAVTIPYDPQFSRRAPSIPPGVTPNYYGASLRAFVNVGRRDGYRLVSVEPRGINAFFLREDVASHLPEISVERGFTMLAKNRKRMLGGINIVAAVERAGLTLEAVE